MAHLKHEFQVGHGVVYKENFSSKYQDGKITIFVGGILRCKFDETFEATINNLYCVFVSNNTIDSDLKPLYNMNNKIQKRFRKINFHFDPIQTEYDRAAHFLF